MDFISRQQLTSDELPPWAGIVFRYPVDSDDLSEKLRAAYPDCKTHRERKHRATIDFLNTELSLMQSGGSIMQQLELGHVKVSTQDSATVASRASFEALPELNEMLSASECASPSFDESKLSPELTERRRKVSWSAAESQESQINTPATTAQQFVWNAHDGRSMRPKTKRKMTTEERSAYKNARKRGACEKCRKQKGRCTHFGDEKESPTYTEDRRTSVDPTVPPEDGEKPIKMDCAPEDHYTMSDSHGAERQGVVDIKISSPYGDPGLLYNQEREVHQANDKFRPSISSSSGESGMSGHPTTAAREESPRIVMKVE